jgi:hypothetical protein
LALAALVIRVVAKVKLRQEVAIKAAAEASASRAAEEIQDQALQRNDRGESDMSLGNSSAAGGGSDMSMGGSSMGGSSMGGSSNGSAQGAGAAMQTADAIDLQDKMFGVAGKKTSSGILISQPSKGELRAHPSPELGWLIGDDLWLYTVASFKVDGGRATWMVKRQGSNDAPSRWDVKQMSQALEAAELESESIARRGAGGGKAPGPGMGAVAQQQLPWQIYYKCLRRRISRRQMC